MTSSPDIDQIIRRGDVIAHLPRLIAPSDAACAARDLVIDLATRSGVPVAPGCHPTWPLCRYRYGKREALAGQPWRGLVTTPF